MRLRLFMSIRRRSARPSRGGVSQALTAATIEEAREEAQAIIEKHAPKDSCDFVCDFAAIIEVPFYEEIVKRDF